MVDRRTEVPTWAYINAQILQEARATGALVPAIARVEQSHGLPAGSLNLENSAFLLSLLYCLVVVPKELWVHPGALPPALASLDAGPIVRLFDIQTKPPDFDSSPLYNLLHRLRNAVAHARFSIADDHRVTFWDQRNDMAPISFRASISLQALMQFLSIVGPVLANLRHIKSGN